MIGLLFTLALFLIIGCATASLAGRGSWFLYGVGVCGSVLFAAGLFGVDLAYALAVLIAASLIILFLRRKRLHFQRITYPRVPSVLMALPLAGLLFSAAVLPLSDYDGRAFWVLKAKALATERKIDGPFFHQQTVHDPRNHYPILIPLDAAAVMMLSGSVDDHHVRWLYVFIFAALVLEVRRRIGRLTTEETGAWCAAILAWTPQFVTTGEGGALSAYNDIAMAALITAAFFELMEGASALRFGLWTSFLVLTKSEGLPLAILLMVAGIWVFRARIVRSLPPLFISVAMLMIWRSRIPAGDEENFLTRVALLPERWERLAPAVSGFLRHLFAVESWGVLWVVAVMSAAVMLFRREWRRAALPLYLIIGMSATYVAVYMVTSWKMADLINASASRLIMHMIGPALTVIAIAGSTRSRADVSGTSVG